MEIEGARKEIMKEGESRSHNESDGCQLRKLKSLILCLDSSKREKLNKTINPSTLWLTR